jgi:hypothetical protein
LIFLTVISVISITSMRSSIIGVRMAQNEEARFAAIEMAQALTESLAASAASTPVIGDVGFTNCTAGELGCTIYAVPLPPGTITDAVAAGHLTARIERMGPLEKPPPRVLESSLDKFSAASFQLLATYDRSDEGQGRVQLAEGILVLVPKN